MELILASNSPRRRQLLTLGGWEFSVLAAEVDESTRPVELPLEYVLRLAQEKARRAAQELVRSGRKEGVVLAADTTVVDLEPEPDRGEARPVILGKPSGPDEAASMLRRLRGRTHQVFTGLAALRLSDGVLLSDWCRTDVPMRDYSEAELQAYIETGDPLDKAGAYAIQHPGFHPVERLRGCYANVVGLPVCHAARLLERLGVHPSGERLLECRSPLPHDCALARQVLYGFV